MFDTLLQSLGLSGGRVVISAILVFLICLIAIKILMKAVEKLLSRSKKMDTVLQGFLKTVVRVALWALAIVIIAGTLGIPTASLVAVISIAGLALSLSVQNILANLFSGITLLITKPFGAGDLIDVGAHTGLVKTVGLFYTVLDTLDNRVVSIPNSDVTGAAVVNYSRNELRRVDRPSTPPMTTAPRPSGPRSSRPRRPTRRSLPTRPRSSSSASTRTPAWNTSFGSGAKTPITGTSISA